MAAIGTGGDVLPDAATTVRDEWEVICPLVSSGCDELVRLRGGCAFPEARERREERRSRIPRAAVARGYVRFANAVSRALVNSR